MEGWGVMEGERWRGEGGRGSDGGEREEGGVEGGGEGGRGVMDGGRREGGVMEVGRREGSKSSLT